MDEPQHSGNTKSIARKRKENGGWGSRGPSKGTDRGSTSEQGSEVHKNLAPGWQQCNEIRNDQAWNSWDASPPASVDDGIIRLGWADAAETPCGGEGSSQDGSWGAIDNQVSAGRNVAIKPGEPQKQLKKKVQGSGWGCIEDSSWTSAKSGSEWGDPWAMTETDDVKGKQGSWVASLPSKTAASGAQSKYIAYNGEPVIVESKRDVDIWCDTIRSLDVRVLGFDTEWKPDRYRGCNNTIALMQLCFKVVDALNKVEHKVLLIRTIQTGVTRKLKSILQDPKIIKAGVDLTCDSRKLDEHFDIVLQGALELDIEYNKRHANGNRNRIGTKNLVKFVLGLEMKKPKSLQQYNWERELTYDSIMYGALDAFVCSRVYEEMIENCQMKQNPIE